MLKNFAIAIFALAASITSLFAQDTVVIQTFTLDNSSRDQVFTFPDEDPNSYEKILMHYRMRCHDAAVNTTGGNGIACGEWDYSCNTYVTDSSSFDSVAATHPSHIISNYSSTRFDYTTNPTYDLLRRTHTSTTVNNKISEQARIINQGSNPLLLTEPNYASASRSILLYTAAQLNAAGMVAGDVIGISLPLTVGSGTLNNVKLGLKHAPAASLDADNLDLTGFTNVFYDNYKPSVGDNFFPFHTAFVWNGTDNILVDLSFDAKAGASLGLLANPTPNVQALSNVNSGYLNFDGSGNLLIDEADFSGIQNEITVSLWVKGNGSFLGSNASTVFEGVDESNLRQINAHLPWSNRRVYWDCGNDGTGYDRIDKLAAANAFSGDWNHWAFVKNATTGRMDIYLNGSLYHAGTGKNKAIEMVKLAIGSGVSGSPVYNGFVDKFRIWKKALSSTEIDKVMLEDATTLASLSADEVLNIEDFGGEVKDLSSQQASVKTVGVVNHKKEFADELKRSFTQIDLPNITFLQGQYDISTSTVTVHDTLFFDAHRVISYAIVNNQPTPVDTIYGYNEYEIVTYDETGEIVDISEISLPNGFDISTLDYFLTTPSKVEIMSFVTPYGINLDLGQEGKMWEFDVTDFATVLRGNKRMTMERGGQNQEEIDIKFLFIKGTPERDILSFNQIWKVNQVSYANISSDKQFQPVSVPVPSGAKYGKIRSMITGHGQEGEFVPRNHFIDINGGAKRFTWQAWTECGDNPIYPQGGTWVFDRAGWCPGAPTDLKLWDVSPYLVGGSPLLVDYGITTATGDSKYIVNHQLVTYGDYNFANDASLEYVIQPSLRTEFERFNTSCVSPMIRVKNRGGQEISSLKIEYWVNESNKLSYDWTGSIASSDLISITLPVNESSFWTGGNNVFYAEIVEVNGSADEYTNNNRYQSPYKSVPVYDEPIQLSYRTNKRGNETSYKLYDLEGNVVYSKSGMSSETTYKDEWNLTPGCYRLEWLDTGQDGLDFWYWAAAGQTRGTGYVRIEKQAGSNVHVFNPDYGYNLIHDFIYEGTTGIAEELAGSVKIFPNPSADGLFTLYHADELRKGDEIKVYDMAGRVQWISVINSAERNMEIDLSNLSTGVYSCQILRSGTVIKVEKLSKL